MKRDHIHSLPGNHTGAKRARIASLISGFAERQALREAVRKPGSREIHAEYRRRRNFRPTPDDICVVIEKLIDETPDALKAGEDLLRRLRGQA